MRWEADSRRQYCCNDAVKQYLFSPHEQYCRLLTVQFVNQRHSTFALTLSLFQFKLIEQSPLAIERLKSECILVNHHVAVMVIGFVFGFEERRGRGKVFE